MINYIELEDFKTPNLKKQYLEIVSPFLKNKFNYVNIYEIPKLKKIQISQGLGLNASNKNYLQKAISEIKTISGQHPILTKAKKSISSFKIREGMPLGLLVTLRRDKMYSFLEKLIKLVFPRIRDFRGMNAQQFDLNGNYNFGISDQLVFPDIEYDNVEAKRGFNITIVTTAKTPNESFFLLKELGFPFSDIYKE